MHRIFSYIYVHNRIEFMAFQDTDEQWWKTAIFFFLWRIDAFVKKKKNPGAALTKSAAFTAWQTNEKTADAAQIKMYLAQQPIKCVNVFCNSALQGWCIAL